MKYIRTNYGIYETEKYCEIRKVINIDGTCYLIINVEGIYEKIIKEADTIEELCDEFVYEYKNSFYKNSKQSYELVKMSLEDMKTTMNSFSGATFYGAIWTDKGLIYVAKMNKDGVFKLI